MASRFATVSKDEILAVNEAAAQTNTKKEAKFSVEKKNSYRICDKTIKKNDPRNTVNWNVKLLTKWRPLFTKSSFFLFLSNWFGKY